MASRAFFSRPISCARLGSFQSAGSSSAESSSIRRADLVSKSKIPPQVFAADLQVGELGCEGIELFGFHDESAVLIFEGRIIAGGLQRTKHLHRLPRLNVEADFGRAIELIDSRAKRDARAWWYRRGRIELDRVKFFAVLHESELDVLVLDQAL